ncbi:maleylacetoacetate isomerase [Altererythrobacter sp. ZODW24]|uniref:maleylacetoacetate isomerase n=1 Tax=Altererythrobacter sp. ZODW24 TaxID=2185142 RepID=UPI000DF7FD3C|nr:maleylacetoacetate isomerase [Altererythrobacter sp. ZODW24]
MRLFGYFRSSTSYRLRIALNLKGLAFENIPVSLLKSEQQSNEFKARNPFAGVPVLEADGMNRSQSMAILEWLDEAHPSPALLPADLEQRFLARELTYAIATELHAPLNLRVLKYLKEPLGHSQDEVDEWYRHWLGKTLHPLEQRLKQLGTGDFLFDAPGMFEAILIPQLYNARKFNFDLSEYPRMTRIEAAALALQPFKAAHPDNQTDSPEYKPAGA